MKDSQKHHYVPQFLIKNFAKANGFISIYDKIDDNRFEANPINIFVENNRNTFLSDDGKKHVIIEQMYAYLDSLIAPVLQEVKGSGNLSGENLKLLLFFAYLMKWRVPQYDESFKNAQDFFSVDDLGLGLKHEGSRLDIAMEPFFDTNFHQELKRFLLAVQPFRFSSDFKNIYNNSFIISTDLPAILGDCPLNEAAIISDEIFEDFVFPITPYLTLVHSKRVDKMELESFFAKGERKKVNQFRQDFAIARDLSTMALSGRFIGYLDTNYFNNVLTGYKSAISNSTLEGTINCTVFNILYNFKDYLK